MAFELAERESDLQTRRSWLTFLVVGAGPTGVELAGAIGELSRHTLRGNFHHIDPATARVLLLEGMDRVLPSYPPKLSAKASKALARLGVTVRVNTVVTNIQTENVTIRSGIKSSTSRRERSCGQPASTRRPWVESSQQRPVLPWIAPAGWKSSPT